MQDLIFNPYDNYFYYGYNTYIYKVNYIANTSIKFDYNSYFSEIVRSLG